MTLIGNICIIGTLILAPTIVALSLYIIKKEFNAKDSENDNVIIYKE